MVHFTRIAVVGRSMKSDFCGCSGGRGLPINDGKSQDRHESRIYQQVFPSSNAKASSLIFFAFIGTSSDAVVHGYDGPYSGYPSHVFNSVFQTSERLAFA